MSRGDPVTNSKNRQIFSGPKIREIPDLLQSLFAAELLVPSRQIWIVSPWISDIPLVDNEAGSFSSVEPEWPPVRIRFSQILHALIERGTRVTIATRDLDHNRPFRDALEALVSATSLTFVYADELHEKGILADAFYLSGSMNFTYNGVHVNTEVLHFFTDPATIAEARITMRERWG
jgi:phosphatidylserine/phosphatidylglycerophosphate/cardiolipin synthase-like enzyme